MNDLTITILSSAESQEAAAALCDELLARDHTVANMHVNAATEQAKDACQTILSPQNAVAFGQLTMLLGIADLVVLVLPADQDAACLAGMAHISGVPVAAISQGLTQECCLTVRGCVSFWCDGLEKLLEIIADWPNLAFAQNEEA